MAKETKETSTETIEDAPKAVTKKVRAFMHPDGREGCGLVKDESGNVLLKVFPDTDVKKELPGYTVE